jgi:hypothetical protein
MFKCSRVILRNARSAMPIPTPRIHLVLRVDVRAQPHELGSQNGVADESSLHECSLANLQHTSDKLTSGRLTPRTGAHPIHRVYVCAKPHELGGRGAVAIRDSPHECRAGRLHQGRKRWVSYARQRPG